MIRFGVVWGLARAEMRLTRRLVRYWVFLALATLAIALAYAQFYFVHYMFSAYSASAASANPRFFIGNLGGNFLLVFLIGIVFLGFDVRARDRRERMVEVLDSLPCTNLELVLGKALGLMIPCWVPVLVISLLLGVVGSLLGAPIEPYSMVGFILFMSIPAYVFTIGLVFFLSLLLRHRLVASLASLVVLIVTFIVALWWVPLYSTPAIDVTGGYSVPFPSDITPDIIDSIGFLQRLALALLGVALLWLSAAIHPRLDDGSPARRAGVGLVVLLVSVALGAGLVFQLKAPVGERERWRAAHEAERDTPVPDMVTIGGNVTVDPGRRLDLDLRLRFRAPEGRALDRALFTLNPGLEVETVASESGGALEFGHENGLLDVALPRSVAPGEETLITLSARGKPDGEFAYLQAALEPWLMTPANAQIFVLGYEPIIFKKRYVALMPGGRWLPSAGPEIRRGGGEDRPTDFYRVDLTVDLPADWLAAGPGRRREPAEPAAAGRVRFRFAPQAPLPDVALVAGRFESHAMEIDGVYLETLIHPPHRKNLEFFDDTTGEIHDWLAERLGEADDLGLSYPYDALTLVEVPTTLRGFAGGWRMDSTLIQPSMILMRESGFPTARFDAQESNFERARDQEGGVPRAKREALGRFFENDINGGNPFIAAARSFFGFQTAGVGPEALPLDFVWENLASRLLSDREGYFSVHFFDQNFGNNFQAAAMGMRDPDRVGDTYSEVLLHMITSTTEVWETALGVSLARLDPWEDPKRTINVLSLKGRAMARSMLDALGREKTGQFLGALRRRAAGEAFTREDVLAAGQEVGEDLESWLAIWIDETDLPGFTLGQVRAQRISDAEDGSPRYQLVVTVRNEESPPGLVLLEYLTEEHEPRSSRTHGEPVRVPGRSAVEIGLVTLSPLRTVRVVPYFSLNRDPFTVPLPSVDQEKVVEAEPFTGQREVDWSPRLAQGIVVDDLDPGFGLEQSEERSMWRFGGRGQQDEELDQGLPISRSRLRPPKWSRLGASYAYGKYRRTMAVVRSGEGNRMAVFTTDLPNAGEWTLEYYLPQPSASERSSRTKPGTWQLTLEDSSGSQEVSFDAAGGESGWNALGTFEIAGGEVQVKVSDSTDGDYVVADAIRWVPVARAANFPAAR